MVDSRARASTKERTSLMHRMANVIRVMEGVGSEEGQAASLRLSSGEDSNRQHTQAMRMVKSAWILERQLLSRL